MVHRPLHLIARTAAILAALVSLHCAAAWSQQNTAAGLNDLVILDPGAHDRGLPAVEVNRVDGGQVVDIPPKLHVHRYYYSGDKVFQGPIIQGGPVIVVAAHPKTGQRMNVQVVLPQGAPRIAHSKNAITYIYGDRRVEVKFQHFPFDPSVAIVKHHSGKGLRRSVRDTRVKATEHVKESLANSKTVNAIKDLAGGGGELVTGATVAIGDVTTGGVDAVKSLASMIPGVTYLKSLSEQKPQKDYESSVQAAGLKNDSTEIPFVRTNR